jgi:hypothetical protein
MPKPTIVPGNKSAGHTPMTFAPPFDSLLPQIRAAAEAADLSPVYVAAYALSVFLANGGSMRDATLALARSGYDLTDVQRKKS